MISRKGTTISIEYMAKIALWIMVIALVFLAMSGLFNEMVEDFIESIAIPSL